MLGDAFVADIAGDPRMLAIAREFLRSRPFAFRATYFEKSAKANWLVAWHQDTALPMKARFDAPGWGPWSQKHGILYAHAPAPALERIIALRLHLDDSTLQNGPLRVLPCTHTLGVLSDQRVRELAASVAAVDCTAPAGSVVAMRPLLIHASSKCSDGRPRRVLHIEYADAPSLGPGIDLAIT